MTAMKKSSGALCFYCLYAFQNDLLSRDSALYGGVAAADVGRICDMLHWLMR
jgi:hypothetical protein